MFDLLMGSAIFGALLISALPLAEKILVGALFLYFAVTLDLDRTFVLERDARIAQALIATINHVGADSLDPHSKTPQRTAEHELASARLIDTASGSGAVPTLLIIARIAAWGIGGTALSSTLFQSLLATKSVW